MFSCFRCVGGVSGGSSGRIMLHLKTYLCIETFYLHQFQTVVLLSSVTEADLAIQITACRLEEITSTKGKYGFRETVQRSRRKLRNNEKSRASGEPRGIRSHR